MVDNITANYPELRMQCIVTKIYLIYTVCTTNSVKMHLLLIVYILSTIIRNFFHALDS